MRFVIGMAVVRKDPDTEPELWLRGGGPLGLRCFPRDRGIFPRYDDERPELDPETVDPDVEGDVCDQVDADAKEEVN